MEMICTISTLSHFTRRSNTMTTDAEAATTTMAADLAPPAEPAAAPKRAPRPKRARKHEYRLITPDDIRAMLATKKIETAAVDRIVALLVDTTTDLVDRADRARASDPRKTTTLLPRHCVAAVSGFLVPSPVIGKASIGSQVTKVVGDKLAAFDTGTKTEDDSDSPDSDDSEDDASVADVDMKN